MAAALPGLALQAFADLWDQQPELAAGLYAVGAVAAAVPRYVPTFEQAKFWCQKPRQPTRPVAESIPVASEAFGTVSTTFSPNHSPPVVIITRSAATSLTSETILTVRDRVEPGASDFTAPFKPAYTDSGSPAVRSVISTESSSFQARPASSATVETLSDVVNKVLDAALAETPNLSSEHIAPKPSIKTSVSSMAASDETAAGSSRRPVRWAGTQTSAPLNISLEPEGESASNSVDAESSASDEEASNCTNMVSAVSPNMSSHGIPTHGNSTPDDPRFSNEATQQTTGIASSSVTSMDSGEFGQKLSRTLFQVVANNLPAMPKSYKQTESSSNDNKDRKPSSKTASSRLPSEQFLSETLDDFSRLGEHRPVFTTSVERQPSEPLHASPLLAESESLSSFKSRYASEQSYVAYRAEREPTASSNYNDFISWLDIVLILVPSILIATSIGFAGNDPLDQDLYATLVATLCTVVVGCLPCLDFRWLTLRYSFLAMYRHSLESISSFMVYLTGFVRQWQETLSGVLRKQHANHIDTDRVPNAVLIGLVFIVLLITINQMISRLSQHAELTRWEANRLRLYKGFVGTIAALIVVWFSGYVQDFILVLTTAGFIYLLHSYYGQILGFASRSVFETCRLVKEAMWPYVAVYAAVTATVYLASHLQQVFDCFKGINGGVSLPINHCAIVVKYGALSIAVLLMHIPIVSRGLRIIRARIQERYNRIAHDRHIAPWHPALGGDRFWLSLTIIVLGAEKVSEVMTEWTVPTLKTGAMLIVTLTLARVLMPLCPMLLSRIWDTVQSCTAELSMTTAHASKEAMLMTSKRALTFQRWSVGLLTRMISDSVSNTWAMVSLALGKISTNSRFFYNTNIEPVVVYIDLSCYSDWCQGRAWGWVPRAITIVLATVLCTAGWVIAARAYPEHKVRSSLSFAVSFMVVYILGTFGALGCTQDYIIVLITMFAILIHLPLEIEAPTDGTPASVALVDETPIDEVLAADELFPDVMQADEDPAVEAPPNPPARPAMSVPGSVALPLPSGWWWQPMIDWLHINNAARAAKERAIEEARVVAEQEIANFRSQVQFTRQDQPLIPTDTEYLQRLRDLTSGTNTTQLPSNEDETQTTRKAWNTTQPFRPMYMYTERKYQAALRGEMPATAISEATLRPLAESVPTPLAQDSAVSVATDLSILASALPSATTSVLAPLFTPATPAASAPQTTTILSTTSSPVRADSSYPATSSSSLFASAPMATPDVTQERIVSINEMPTEVDNPDALPILMASSSGSRPQGDCNHETSTPIATTTTPAVLDRTPFHELAFAPVTGLAEPGMPAMDPGSEQGPSSLPNPTVSASIVQSAEPSPGPSKSLDEDKLAAELGHTGTEDRIGYVENAQADDQQQDRQHNEGDSDDEEEFSSSGGVTGLGDRTFEEEPIDKTEGLDDEDLAAAKQLHEEMESGAKRNEAITSVQAASDEAPPLTDNCDDNEQTGTKTEQPVGRTLMDVDSVIIPSTAGDGFQDEHGNVIDTPMSDVPENGADMLELKVLSANSGDDITMGGTDNEEASDRGGGNDDEPEEEDGGTGGNRPTSDKSSGDGEKLDANKPSPVAHPSISMGDVVGCSLSEEGIHGEIVPDTQFSNDVHTSDNKLESNDPKDEDGGDDSSDCSEPHGRLQASTVGGTTSAAPFSNAGEAIAAAADTTMMKNDEDSEMIDVAIIGEAEMGNAGCNASASAQFNTTGLLKAIQASQSADGQPNEGFTTPSGMEGGQDHITDDDDDWDSIYASANGHVSSPNMQRSSNAQDPPIDPSGTYSPFSNVSSGDSDGNVSSSHQIDDFETEQLAQIEATKKDKQMQIDAQRDLGLPLNGYVQLPGIRNQSHDDIRRADDKHGDLTAGIMRIDYNNHDTDYQQTHGIDRDFETSPDSSPGDVQLPTAVDDETNPDTDGLNWTDIRPKTRLVQLWEDRQIVDNPDYPPHRSAGMRPLETTYGQPCQIFREVDVAAYEFFGENHENFQYAQEGVDWFHPEAEGAEPREEFEGEVGEENNVAANEVGRVDDDLSARVAASKTESNAAFRLDYSDSESTLSDPPDSTGLDTIGANLLTEEMDCKILVPKNGGRELIDNSALVSEEAYPSKKGNSVSASLPDDDDTESHLVITDAMREKAARFGCTTDSQILDFMESIDRPEKREGGKFLIPKSWKDRKGNVAGSSTSSAVMLSPLQAPAQQSVPKKRYNGPVSFKFDEGDVQPRLKPAPPMTKNLLEKMADFNSDPVKRAALQDMANKVGDTSKIQSPAWTSAIATNNSPFASKFQDASNSPRLQKSNSTSPSSYPRSSISSSGYDSIRASSLPFDPSKPRPYVPEGFDPGVLDKLNSTNPFGRSSSTNASTPSYLQRDAIISPTRRLVYRPMRLPEATLSTLDDPLVRSSAHNPSNTSTEMAAPPVNPPIYDSLQPAAGMASEISSVGSLSYDYMEPSVGYTVQPAVSDATELSNDSPRSAHQPSALPATTTIDPNRMVDIDSDP
ncbi:hypothetical protein IG631_22380 [Alternaria alternata]|nr:hypothetical protein IG631_22380 [Alternaria alternata]